MADSTTLAPSEAASKAASEATALGAAVVAYAVDQLPVLNCPSPAVRRRLKQNGYHYGRYLCREWWDGRRGEWAVWGWH